MARSTGVIRLKGKVGDVIIYELNGKLVARGMPIPKKQTKTAAHKDAKRRGGLEFGAASVLSRSIRDSLSKLKPLMGPYAAGRLTSQLLKVCRSAEGEKGLRPLLMSRYGKLLEGFELNDKHKLDQLISGDARVKALKNSFELLINNFNVKALTGATHCRIVFAAARAFDWHYNKKEKRYLPQGETPKSKNLVTYCDMLSISDMPEHLWLTLHAGKLNKK